MKIMIENEVIHWSDNPILNVSNFMAEPNPGIFEDSHSCLLYTSPSPRDRTRSRMPSSA